MNIIWKDITGDIINNIAPYYSINNYGEILNKLSNTKLYIKENNTCTCQNIFGKSMTVSIPRTLYKVFISNNISDDDIVWFKDNNDKNIALDNLILINRKKLKDIKFNINAENNSNLSNQEMSMAQYYRSDRKSMVYNIDEVWTDITEKSVPNVKPWYKILNYGRVYSKATGCLVNTTVINSGYVRVQLRSKDNTKLDALIHRIMMIEFNPIDNYNEMEVNHKDGNGFHNNLQNMNWLSKLDNAIYKATYNVDNFTEEQVIAICEALQHGLSYIEICLYVLHTGYTSRMHTRIYDIHKRKSYVNITKNYTF